MILERVQPDVDEVIAKEQAEFRENRRCEEQVLALTTLIKSRSQRKLKTRSSFNPVQRNRTRYTRY